MPRYSPIWICICVFFFVLLLFPCSLLIVRVSESPCFIFVVSFYLYFCFSCFDRTYVCSITNWSVFFVYVCFDSALFIEKFISFVHLCMCFYKYLANLFFNLHFIHSSYLPIMFVDLIFLWGNCLRWLWGYDTCEALFTFNLQQSELQILDFLIYPCHIINILLYCMLWIHEITM